MLAVFLIGTRTHAALLAYEPFDHPPATELLGLTNGFGFSGAWTNAGYDPNLRPFKMESGALTYPGLAVQGTNRLSAVAVNGVAVAGRRLAMVPGNTNGTYYLSFLHRTEGVSNYASVVFGVGRGAELSVGKSVHQPYSMSHRGGKGRVFSPAKWVEGRTAFIVVKMELQEGDDRITLYVDPQPGQGEPRQGVVKEDLDLQFADTIFLQSRTAWSVDEIRFGTTWADVTPAASNATTK